MLFIIRFFLFLNKKIDSYAAILLKSVTFSSYWKYKLKVSNPQILLFPANKVLIPTIKYGKLH
jgi:hypothetical protein